MISVFLNLVLITTIYMIIVLGYRLIWRDVGIISLAHAAFCGIGAYVTALALAHVSADHTIFGGFLNTIFSLIFGAIITMIFAAISGFFLIRIKGDYFVLLTLAIGESLRSFAANSELTGGNLGLRGISKPEILGMPGNTTLIIIALTAFLVLFHFSKRVYSSRLGLDLHTIRDNERLGFVVGLHSFKLKWGSFIAGSGMAGLGGGLLALTYGYIDPTLFGINEIVLILTLTALSVSGSPKNTIIMASLFLTLYLLLPWLPLPPNIVGPMQQLILGVTIIGVVLFSRESLNLEGSMDE